MRNRLKNSDGQMVIFMALIFPLFLLLLVCLVNLGLLIHQKIRLQTAVDAGVYSAAASLARDLNEIAFLNENINAIYQGDPSDSKWRVTWEDSLKDKLTGDSFNDDTMLKNYFDQYHNKYWKLRDMIDAINGAALDDAENVGRLAAALTFYNGNETYADVNPNQFEFTSLYDGNPLHDGTMIKYTAYGVEEAGSYIKTGESGNNPFDPYAGYCENCVKEQVGFWIRKESPVYFCAKAQAKSGFKNVWPAFFPIDFAEKQDGQILLQTYAASQPYGGSVGGYANTYRATLIPINDKAQAETEIEFWH